MIDGDNEESKDWSPSKDRAIDKLAELAVKYLETMVKPPAAPQPVPGPFGVIGGEVSGIDAGGYVSPSGLRFVKVRQIGNGFLIERPLGFAQVSESFAKDVDEMLAEVRKVFATPVNPFGVYHEK